MGFVKVAAVLNQMAMHFMEMSRCSGSLPELPAGALGTTTKHLKSSGMNFFQLIDS